MKFINLTPHDVVLDMGGTRITFEKDRMNPTARVEHVNEQKEIQYEVAPNVRISLPIISCTKTEVKGLPQPKPGVTYIVSTMVASYTQRPDLISPLTDSTCERDSTGRVTSIKAFQTFVKPSETVENALKPIKRFGHIGGGNQ